MSDLTHLNKELVLLIIQFLGDEKYKGTMHMLEQESGFFFDLTYFEEKILNGEWDELERYISGFTKYNDNRHSIKIMYEITKQKYLEALDRNLKAEAADILVKELRKFSLYNPEVYKDLTELLTLHNLRENAHLSQYANIRSARERMVVVLTKVVKTNPLLKDKLIFPTAGKSRLRKLINQSLNWQHDQCKNPVPNPVVRTLYEDHYCPPPLIGPLPRPFFGQPLPLPRPFPVPFPSVEGAIAPYQAHGEVASLKRPRTTPATVSEVGPSITGFTAIDRMVEELEHSRYNVEGTSQTSTQLRTSWLAKNLPKNVAYSFHQGSKVTSMDFHPNQHTLLLVGARNGEFSIWELKSQQRVASEPFKIWDTAATSLELQGTLSNEEACISVSRVTWSPDGNYFGVAYTRNLIHLYAHSGINEICQCLEINAHDGRVNDLAFDHRDKELYLITCGDDKLIKVWDIAGQNLYNFVGHEAPVYSVCPHHNKNFQFIFSTSIDGKIRTWMYDNEGPISGCDAPGNWCTTLIFKSDGSSRMFSCGTSKEGDTFLVQWSANNGIVDDEAKRKIYSGFTEKSARIAHFDITNQFLAVGEDSQIKYWHMDHDDVLASTNVEGGLPSRPCLRFNKEGSLLAVTTANEGFMILANGTGHIRVGLPYSDKLRVPTESTVNKETGSSLGANVNEDNGKSERSSPSRPSTSHVSFCD